MKDGNRRELRLVLEWPGNRVEEYVDQAKGESDRDYFRRAVVVLEVMFARSVRS